MFALARIGVFVEGGAVETSETVGILREVGGDPVEDHPEAALVTAIHEVTELVGRAEAARRCEITAALVAPRSVEGIFRHRHQLEVGVTHVDRVIDEFVGQLAVG